MPPMTKVIMKASAQSIGVWKRSRPPHIVEKPVEDFDARRHGDDHRRDAEEAIDVGARAHREEMVQPNENDSMQMAIVAMIIER